MTILRSDQFLVGAAANLGIVLRDEDREADGFSTSYRSTGAGQSRCSPKRDYRPGDRRRARVIARRPDFVPLKLRMVSDDRILRSPGRRDQAGQAGFRKRCADGAIRFAGRGNLESGSIVIPRQTWTAVSWKTLDNQVRQNCPQPMLCAGEFSLQVRLDSGLSMTEVCNFSLDEHVLAHLRGMERRYFTSRLQPDSSRRERPGHGRHAGHQHSRGNGRHDRGLARLRGESGRHQERPRHGDADARHRQTLTKG